jgi:hypothetical protein
MGMHGAEFLSNIAFHVLGSQWTDSERPTPYEFGAGLLHICAHTVPADQCAEPMPDHPMEALIGAGAYAMPSLNIEQGGDLYLRINEEDAALADNSGAIVIEIQGNISSV